MSIPDLETYLPKVISWRRDLHMHPELGLQEVRTSNLIADLLTKFGLDVQRNFAGTAVFRTLHTNKPGKTVVLRADMDALPIQDAKDVPYRSQISGVCHACGHDAHTANLLGVANYISDHRTEFCGTIKFLFQPAEELLEGAKLVCQSGVLDGTDYILGQHAVLDVDVGQVQVCYGPSNGGGDEFTLRLHGVGCHGARPHTGKDPILLAAKVIEGFQQIISRELDPLKAAVISVCSVQAGQHESKCRSAGGCVSWNRAHAGRGCTHLCFDSDGGNRSWPVFCKSLFLYLGACYKSASLDQRPAVDPIS